MANENPAKKPSFIARLKRFFKDINGEIKKIVWPNRRQVINNTGVVVVAVVISSVFISLIDYFFGLVTKLFFGS
ncbi:MAG TPA: preprotein translocase subunit SecE [Oscillospiraceae bacterium]|nr:preprotein translocase subunit SecE [Oscillospiraceae bacterium]HXK78299.1 preprotein translocase subunit SecE [Oscillospiraceae bacterium]